ncbi:hypothetical protein JDV02_008344 [Purpureocillium takamizusanense]|uniref:Uncharacterized protein n=1 Tax=Purpureocillium takamizusanense TaxID=2060973 RepID=A0A9Q8QMQ7_9HYPO|nr:uncharacterized protein JDV02_008344 [Purpureocillium takamizusanense]UNI22455.1 hypothetical protein JDV02_008344 [Purpureocillium takamizusanense]
MGAVGAAIKFIAIPIVLVVLAAFLIIFFRTRKRRAKDIEQAETFTEYRLPQPPPPTYNGPSIQQPAGPMNHP